MKTSRAIRAVKPRNYMPGTKQRATGSLKPMEVVPSPNNQRATTVVKSNTYLPAQTNARPTR